MYAKVFNNGDNNMLILPLTNVGLKLGNQTRIIEHKGSLNQILVGNRVSSLFRKPNVSSPVL